MSRRVCLQRSWPFLNGHRMAAGEAGIILLFRESGWGVKTQMNKTHF